MKYARLTQEQLEELHQEFITFLATQTITAKEWEHIKEKKPEVAEQELDVFSDLIWEGVLEKVQYLQNWSAQQLYAFYMADTKMELIALKISNSEIDITTKEGMRWLQENMQHESVSLYTASKSYSEEKKIDIFKLIQQGAVISDGQWYHALAAIVKA